MLFCLLRKNISVQILCLFSWQNAKERATGDLMLTLAEAAPYIDDIVSCHNALVFKLMVNIWLASLLVKKKEVSLVSCEHYW